MDSYTSRPVARRTKIGSTQQLPPHIEFKESLEEILSSSLFHSCLVRLCVSVYVCVCVCACVCVFLRVVVIL